MKKLTFILALFSLFCCATYAQKLSRSLDANGYELQNANLETWDDLPPLDSGDAGRIGYYVSKTKIYYWSGTVWKKVVNELDSPTFDTLTAATANAQNANVTGSLVTGGGSAASGYELTNNADSRFVGELLIGPGTGAYDPFAEMTIVGAEAASAGIALHADDGDDNADKWLMYSSTAGNLWVLASKESGSYVTKFQVDGTNNQTVIGGGSAASSYELTNNGKMWVSEGGSGGTPVGTNTSVFESDEDCLVSLLAGGSTNTSSLYLGDAADGDIGAVKYNHSTNAIVLRVGNVDILSGTSTSIRLQVPILSSVFVVISSALGDPRAPYPAKNILINDEWIIEKKAVEEFVQSEIALGHVNLRYHWRWDERYALWLQTKDLTAEVRIVPVTKTIPRQIIAKENAFETFTTEEVVTEQKIPVIKSTKIQYVLKGDKVVQQERPIYKTQPVKKKRLKEGVQFDESDGTFFIPAREIQSGTKEVVIKSKEVAEAEAIRALDCNHQFFEKIHHSPIAELVDKDFQYAPNGYVEGYDRNALQDYLIEQQQKEIAALKSAMENLIGR